MIEQDNDDARGPAHWLTMTRTIPHGRTMAGSAIGDHVYEHFWMDGARASDGAPGDTGVTVVGKGLRIKHNFRELDMTRG